MEVSPNIMKMIFELAQNDMDLYDIEYDKYDKNQIILIRKINNDIAKHISEISKYIGENNPGYQIIKSKYIVNYMTYLSSGAFMIAVQEFGNKHKYDKKRFYYLGNSVITIYDDDASVNYLSYRYIYTIRLTQTANDKMFDFCRNHSDFECILCPTQMEFIRNNNFITIKNGSYNRENKKCGCGSSHADSLCENGWIHDKCKAENLYNCDKCGAELHGITNIGIIGSFHHHIKCDKCDKVTCRKCACLKKCEGCYKNYCETDCIITINNVIYCLNCGVMCPCCNELSSKQKMIICYHCDKIQACKTCYHAGKSDVKYKKKHDEFYCSDCDKLNYDNCVTCDSLIHENDLCCCNACGKKMCAKCTIYPSIREAEGTYKLAIDPYCNGCVKMETITMMVAKINPA